jgi:acyl-[acyl-carrier-protein]-phospholipid O-acyltransferase/long-chain-fatty-acid--[acyl-carrier-protein] ligase
VGFVIIGCLTGALAFAAVIVLPDFLVRFLAVVVTRLAYRLHVIGRANIPVKGPALILPNHVTWVDALLLLATQQRRIRFLMERHIYANRWMNPVFRLMGVIPISSEDGPRAIVDAFHRARQALDQGYLVCLFPEGALTLNGNMRAFRPGFERIVRGTNCPVIPAYIGGAWGSIFSYYHGRLLGSRPRRLPYPVTIAFGHALPATASASEIRLAVQELAGAGVDSLKSSDRTLAREFVRVARRHWRRPAVADSSGKSLRFGALLTTALLIRDWIRIRVGEARMLGVLLPPSVGGVCANVGVMLAGRIPVNLNYTASRRTLEASIERCGIRMILSSRVFLDKLGQTEPLPGVVCLEDLLPGFGSWAKVKAWCVARWMPRRRLAPGALGDPDAMATVIFSSGSTGDPKGVLLSHHNIISNIEQFRSIFRFSLADGMAGVLPFFHSFGFTATLWCPLLSGFRVVYHANPMDGAGVAQVVRDHRLSILLSTPTFLLAYIHKAKKEDFASLRTVLVGAEKLKGRIADSFEARFGIRPLEGYGATELSPVAALSIPDVVLPDRRQTGCKEGSVGHPLPAIAAKITDDEGRALPWGEEGVLWVRGPNVMRGYLDDPDRTAEVVHNGWYNTGDIARLDEDGFLFLVDRLSRFSKIGGEMVPHVAIEDLMLNALGAVRQVVCVTSAPDEKKGERLIVFHTPEAGTLDNLNRIIAESDLPNLWKPKRESFVSVPELPTLGSGKLDLKSLRQMAKTFVENEPGLIHRIADRVTGRGEHES